MKQILWKGGVSFLAVALFSGRPSLASAPNGHYTLAGQTVIDAKTKLIWQQSSPSGSYSWTEAKTYCASAAVSQMLGGTGWRLPTERELLTIFDPTQSTGVPIDPDAFPDTPASFFWSATNDSYRSGEAWGVGFGGPAGAGPLSISITTAYAVRCVR